MQEKLLLKEFINDGVRPKGHIIAWHHWGFIWLHVTLGLQITTYMLRYSLIVDKTAQIVTVKHPDIP